MRSIEDSRARRSLNSSGSPSRPSNATSSAAVRARIWNPSLPRDAKGASSRAPRRNGRCGSSSKRTTRRLWSVTASCGKSARALGSLLPPRAGRSATSWVGHSKEDAGCHRARRASEKCFQGASKGGRPRASDLCGRVLDQHRHGAQRERAYAKAPRNWGRNVTLISSITTEGMGPSVSIEGSPETKSFSLYMRNVLIPRLRAGQIVLMDNLSMHKSKWVRDLVEEKGCQLWLLPSSSPDMNPIKEALSKVKNFVRKAKVRTLEALFVVTGGALEVVSKEDARGFFEACGYHTPQDHSL